MRGLMSGNVKLRLVFKVKVFCFDTEDSLRRFMPRRARIRHSRNSSLLFKEAKMENWLGKIMAAH